MRLGSGGNGRRLRSQTVGMNSLPQAQTKLQAAERILIAHQRHRGGCLCGWSELGKSLPGHQAVMLREAGLLSDEPDAARKEGNDASGSG